MMDSRDISPAILACALALVLAPLARAAGEASAAGAYVKPEMKHESYGETRIVVPLTSGEKRIQIMKLRNIKNAFKAADAWGGKLDLRLVLYSDGVSMLANPDEDLRKGIDELRALGLQIEVCNNTLLERGIDFHSLYRVSNNDMVPSGFAEVAYLQSKLHFAVDPSN